MEAIEYWKERCLAAEKYILLSPCDPEDSREVTEAYLSWLELRNMEDEQD